MGRQLPLREYAEDIWTFDATVRVVPTNAVVKHNGLAVMGAGLARQAVARYPNLPEVLGKCIRANPKQRVHSIRHDVLTFQTKDDWRDPARLDLIEQSAAELVVLANKMPHWRTIALPRVGCGNGELRWTDVRPILEAAFGDDPRFVVVDNS